MAQINCLVLLSITQYKTKGMQEKLTQIEENSVAVIGMSLRFPGANDVDTFWKNLQLGKESISRFGQEELLAAGESLDKIKQADYVNAHGWIEGIDLFDANFFNYTPAEAKMLDPQQRLFLEGAWQAMEHAGYNVDTCEDVVGVYGGAGMNNYIHELLRSSEFEDITSRFQLMITNGNDFISTRVSYKLNLKGPAINLQTACSTSLVAVHMACQSILNGECDMALAGGVSIVSSRKKGYHYQEGMITSPDGHCRAFDEKAQGTVVSNGMGIVVLKPLAHAIADGDTIYATIKSSAINNDGSNKIGYTAPSIEGQAAVIQEALAIADIEPHTISYIEAHGTGTPLGDPIEVEALKKAFNLNGAYKNHCAIGSLKSNIGHLDTAAGVAGLIKAILALKHQQIPPSLHFEKPNPMLNIENSPFYINNTLQDWKKNGSPRRAGVSAFGIGGTNAHVILEEPPAVRQTSEGKTWQIIPLSAKTDTALRQATKNLGNFLHDHPEISLPDAAYTLQIGRKAFDYRQVLVVKDIEDASTVLNEDYSERIFTKKAQLNNADIVFMFPGHGSEYVNMAREVYEEEVVFREYLDRCAEILIPHLTVDIRAILFPELHALEDAEVQFRQAAFTQPIIFSVGYALAQLFLSWGIKPSAMIGHSIGEYAAACIAGVFSLEDALKLVVKRGSLVQEHVSGSMLAILAPHKTIVPLLIENVHIAAINTKATCVVSGTKKAINEFDTKLKKQGLETRKVHTNFAAHSPLLDKVLEEYEGFVSQVQLNIPHIPYISSHTGSWVRSNEVTDPAYWAAQLRQPVRFDKGIQEIITTTNQILLELGGGRTLTTFAKTYIQQQSGNVPIPCLPHVKATTSSLEFLYQSLGKIWLNGGMVDWKAFHTGETRQRIPLPTYPFERKRYWVDVKQRKEVIYAIQEEPVFSLNEQEVAYVRQNGAVTEDNRPALDNAYIPPGNEQEKHLVELWQRQLDIRPIGIYDNFFDLGGSSLTAIQLTGKMRNALNIPIAASTLLENPTIARLVKAIEESQTISSDYADILIRLQQGEPDGQPLFVIHPISGTVYSCRTLVQALNRDIPVYGIQSRGMDGSKAPLTDIKAMADLYTEAILSVQSDGPYQLLGYSMGGMIAFEIAHRPRAQGKALHFLGMIDTAIRDDFSLISTEAEIISYLLDQQLNLSYEESLKELNQLPDSSSRVAYYIKKMSGSQQTVLNLDEIDMALYNFMNNIDVMLKYQPDAVYSDTIVQFVPELKSRFNVSKPEQTWKHWIEQWEVHEIGGNHVTMMELPHVEKMAAVLDAGLIKEKIS